jgi:hypothetical protein
MHGAKKTWSTVIWKDIKKASLREKLERRDGRAPGLYA